MRDEISRLYSFMFGLTFSGGFKSPRLLALGCANQRTIKHVSADRTQLSCTELGGSPVAGSKAAFFSLCCHCTTSVSVVVWVSVPEVPVTVTVEDPAGVPLGVGPVQHPH